MSVLLFADNASTLLASGIAPTDTTIVVTSTTGALFSSPGANQYALGTIEDVSGNIEIVKITARTGDSFTVVRAQEGTTALSFSSGSRFEQRVTAGMLALFLQKVGGDVLSGSTAMSGVIAMGSSGSIQGGEIAGTAIRSQPGDTSNQILVPIGAPATAAGSTILTAGNIVSHLGAGLSLLQTGMICIWSGPSNTVPLGFHICDGTNGTPDLRDHFVMGAGGVLPTSGGSAVTTTGVGGSIASASTDSHTLTVGEMPAHGHDFWAHAPANYSGSGTFQTYEVDAGSGPGYLTQVNGNNIIKNTGGGAGHSHTLTGIPGHTHSYTFPPYVALFYIMKT